MAEESTRKPTPPPPTSEKPWRRVSSLTIRDHIEGTLLADMVAVLQSVTDPPLPIELTLPKALALAGCALSQPVTGFNPLSDPRRGRSLARVVIQTGRGQMCNVWACIVARSGIGKDIGNLPVEVATETGVHLGNTGSAEGLADAISKTGGGLLTISELQNFLTAGRWEREACPVLTSMFNGGQAKWALSKRRGGERDIPYCAPSILANVQPEVMRSVEDKLLIHSGFLPRFLFSRLPEDEQRFWRPNTETGSIDPMLSAFEAYRNFHATVRVPKNYLSDVLDEFIAREASLPSHFSRLVNEYGPRFATMLAANRDTPDRIEISDSHWKRAGDMVRWFYSMAEDVLCEIGESASMRKRTERIDRGFAFIRKFKEGVKYRDFSQRFGRDTTADMRRRDIGEMEERGLITVNPPIGHRGSILKACQ